MTDRSHMTIDRLRALLDAYGADPDHWPQEERAAAEALLAQSIEAQRYRDASLQLDALLDLAPADEPSRPLVERILAVGVQGAGTEPPMPRHLGRTTVRSLPSRARRDVLPRGHGWRYVGTALPLAAAAALVLWLLHRPAPIADPVAVAVVEIGVYDAPTDALLSATGLDALDSVPSFGCAGSGLGCLDPQPVDSQSALHWETYV
jgi:hypothetical protein